MTTKSKSKAPPATITVVEAAKRLRIGRTQCYAAVRKGQLPVIKIGRRLLIPTAKLDRMLGELV